MRRLTIRPIYLDVLSKADGSWVETHDITYWTDEQTDALVASIDYSAHLIRVRSYPRPAISRAARRSAPRRGSGPEPESESA